MCLFHEQPRSSEQLVPPFVRRRGSVLVCIFGIASIAQRLDPLRALPRSVGDRGWKFTAPSILQSSRA